MADTVYKLDPEILIGRETINRAGALSGSQGKKILVATEQGLYENKQIERLTGILEEAGLEAIIFDEIPSHSTADAAETAASLARGARCDMVLGFGSLNTQYTARLISILAVSPIDLFSLLDGEREETGCLPYVAIPTAGGDPFLLTDYLVAVDPRDRFAKMIKCPRRMCRAVIFDSAFSESLSGKLAAVATFDGLCGVLEAYCSVKSSFLSDAFLEQAISLYARMMHSLAEERMADFSVDSANAALLMSLGAAASTPGIGAALAYSLNSKFPVDKSWCTTVLLPYIMEKLVSSRPEKMAKAAAILGDLSEGTSTANAASAGVETVRRFMGQLSVPARLKDFNLSLDRLVSTADAARNMEFVTFSPWTVSSEDAYDLLKQAF